MNFDDRLSLARRAVLEHLGKLRSQFADCGFAWSSRFVDQFMFKIVLAPGQLLKSRLEGAYARGALVSAQLTLFEGVQVAVEGVLRGLLLPGDVREFFGGGLLSVGAELSFGCDGPVDEVAVGVQVDQGGQDGVVEFGSRQTWPGTAVTSVADARETGAVAVDAGPAGGCGTDVFQAAVRAGDESGQVIVGVGCPTPRASLAASGEYLLDFCE